MGSDDPLAAAWVLDLDGVVWLGDQPLPGAAEAVARLRAHDCRLAFVTNNAQHQRAHVARHLERVGIDPADDVLTSAMAVAALVEPGQRVLACAGPGVVEALENRGVEVLLAHATGSGSPPPVDAVVVGKHEDFSYSGLRSAALAIRAGARFLATNTDVTYPTPFGLEPGAGALVAAVATATRREPDAIAGKPHEPMAHLVAGHLLTGDGVVVGDRPDTDGLFARRLGFAFVLVLSGVTRRGDLPVDPAPDRVADDLASLVDAVLGAGQPS
jgi:HAD superfamily hydrolase (TIGR01450 family)